MYRSTLHFDLNSSYAVEQVTVTFKVTVTSGKFVKCVTPIENREHIEFVTAGTPHHAPNLQITR